MLLTNRNMIYVKLEVGSFSKLLWLFHWCTLQASVKALRAAQFAVDARKSFQSLDDVRPLATGQIF